MNLLKKIIPSDERELEERYERIRHDAIHKVDKTVSGIGKEVSNQVAPTDFIAAMYAPTERKTEESSGDTVSFKDQITLKPGELLGDVTGTPEQPGQKPETVSAIGQVTVPAPEILGAMMGSPVGSEENTSTESGIEQMFPTAGQLIGHATGSVQTERVTPHMETAAQQVIPSIDEFAGHIGITSSESKHVPQQPSESGAAQHQEGEAQMQQKLAQQHSGQQAQLDRAGIDPAMQMNQQERVSLNQEQKEKREHMMLHDREYRKFGTPLDPIGSLEEQVSKVRQQKEQEEKQKLQEEEEEKKREEEEKKKQQEEQLEMPGGKPKQGEPVSVNQAKKKTEIHRGAAG